MKHRSTIYRIFAIIAKLKKLFFTSTAFTLITVLASLLGPILIGETIDQMIGPGHVKFETITKYLFIIATIYIIGCLSLWVVTVCTNKIAYHTSHTLRAKLFDKLGALPLNFYDSTAHGDVISRFVNDADTVADGLLQSISVLLTGSVTIIGAIIFMLRMNVTMAIIVILSAPISYYVAKFITTKSRESFKRQAAILGELNGYAEEILSTQKVIKAFCYETESNEVFKKMNKELYRVGLKAQFFSALTNPSTRLVNNITYGVVGITGALLAIQGTLTVGLISSFLLYANLFAKPFNEITGVIPQLQSAFASAKRIFNLLDADIETSRNEVTSLPVPTRGAVLFQNVNFGYVPEKRLIKNFNLKVDAGSKVAIVGATGAGKTTLINLLMRFYDIDSGDILIDDVSIFSMPREIVRQSFGMVLQDTWLFKGTIRDNITYGMPNATEEEMLIAAKASGAHSFIRRLSLGYDTIISDSGDSLSQGQKQLLTITRVMLTNPSMLILDEATSNIDTLTELHIQSAFTKMMKGKTSFVIAHRLSTIKDADLILVMNQGDIVESGTHEELLQQDGVYAKLYNSQFGPQS